MAKKKESYVSTVTIMVDGVEFHPGDELKEVRPSQLESMIRLGQATKSKPAGKQDPTVKQNPADQPNPDSPPDPSPQA